MPCHALRARIQFCLGDYDQLMHLAVLLIYVQIGCSLVGSLGASFNGVPLVNLVIALFALVAIESSSQSLGRTYALLLCCGILLDVFWFILFSRQIWNISSHDTHPLFVFSLRLQFCMQIAGFSVRTASSFLWIQMYRLGLSNVENTLSRLSDLRYSFLNPSSPALRRQNSHSDEILGGSIYDPTYYSSLFEGPQDNKLFHEDARYGGIGSMKPNLAMLIPSRRSIQQGEVRSSLERAKGCCTKEKGVGSGSPLIFNLSVFADLVDLDHRGSPLLSTTGSEGSDHYHYAFFEALSNLVDLEIACCKTLGFVVSSHGSLLQFTNRRLQLTYSGRQRWDQLHLLFQGADTRFRL
ncbi:hypothetical protein Sjap_012095 [Stephania japonica]|uniref:Uncharacterized protein n=1 Tax=Stephania japonica TaxID=461633 RepID=A0AAP0IX26_9MAGN